MARVIDARWVSLGTSRPERVVPEEEWALRVDRRYDCPVGPHAVVVPLAVEAEVPPAWGCPWHGTPAELVREGVDPEEVLPVVAPTPVRTHWDMVLERRSIAELEALLQERLDALSTRGCAA